jgi:hypothetical protein
MNPAIIISLVTLVVGSSVSLIIAALHRKQIRQVELHREDASVPLKPPPHPFTMFLWRNAYLWVFLISFSLNLVFLIRCLSMTTPPTRRDMLAIALFTGGLFSACLQYMVMRIFEKSMDVVFDAIIKNLQIAMRIGSQLTRVIKVVETLVGHAIEETAEIAKKTPEPPKKPRK